MRRPLIRTLLAGAVTLLASAGQAQLLPGLGSVPGQLVGALGSPADAPLAPPIAAPVLDRLNDIGGQPLGDSASLLDLRRARLRELVQQHRAVLDADREGNPVRRGELIAVDPSLDTIARIRAAGFRVMGDDHIEGIGLHVVTIAPPPGTSTREGLTRIRTIAPNGEFDFDPIFEPAGLGLLAPVGAAALTSVLAHPAAIGMIDGGVSTHPSLRNAAIEQRGFTAHGARASGHGTAVASLMVGSDGRFHGAAPGASLLVADVYGGDPADGSALAIARALGWLTARGVRVINISLVGPANPLLERAIAAAAQRGVLIVAAVGNDGPAAPPAYPASYPGVIAVTGVDDHNRALPEAGKALHLDYAAPGADMAAALPGSGYAVVRGTSFAAPLVTAQLVAAGGGAGAIAALSREAVKGSGRIGKGIVCDTCRIAPRDVGARRQ
ncbi:MAG: S8 family serine peptidase [Pseudomonadota bacterium]|nr:S8 family serine peptidase [Pseudomonadota bacterium]